MDLWVERQLRIALLITSLVFSNPRASSSPNLNLEHLIHPTITEEENQNLCMVHNDVEIKQAIFNKGAIKTPKPNLFVIFLLALLKY